MIKLENTEIYGWNGAVRGMRNPFNSWDKSDSYWTHIEDGETEQTAKFEFYAGENDLKLMKKLATAGDDHGKFARMINVSVDITAPLYWWKEMDTYKVGTVADSCSTMHTIQSKEFEYDDFSHEHLDEWAMDLLTEMIGHFNNRRIRYNATGNKEYWWQMIQLLPTSYNQKRTWTANYQVLYHIYNARRGHKLDEWSDFREWIGQLPYFKEIYGIEE